MSPTSQGAPELVPEHNADPGRHSVVFAALVATNTNGFLFLPPCHYVNLVWACDLQPKGEDMGVTRVTPKSTEHDHSLRKIARARAPQTCHWGSMVSTQSFLGVGARSDLIYDPHNPFFGYNCADIPFASGPAEPLAREFRVNPTHTCTRAHGCRVWPVN